MRIGPNREKRPADAVANALLVPGIATGKAEEIGVVAGQSWGGRKDTKDLLDERRAAAGGREARRQDALAPWRS